MFRQMPLRPIFATKVCRTVQLLELSGATIEIAFDEGSIEAGEYCASADQVIELELLSWYPLVLYDLGIRPLDMLYTLAHQKVRQQSKSDRVLSTRPWPGAEAKVSKARAPDISTEYSGR